MSTDNKDGLECPICSNLDAKYWKDYDIGTTIHHLSCLRCGTGIINDKLTQDEFFHAIGVGFGGIR